MDRLSQNHVAVLPCPPRLRVGRLKGPIRQSLVHSPAKGSSTRVLALTGGSPTKACGFCQWAMLYSVYEVKSYMGDPMVRYVENQF